MICPFAEWKPAPSSNYGHDGKAKIGLVVHHMDGSMASADGWFRNPNSSTSAHFGIAYDGHLVQWVDTADVAYAQCMGNWQGWVSVENESDPDRPNDPPTAAQVATMGRLIAWLGTPAVPATSMYSGGVGYHRQFPGPCAQAWGQTACPGDGFIAAIPAICAAAGGTAEKPTPTEDTVLYKTTDNGHTQWYREVQGYLIPIADDIAFRIGISGARQVDLGGPLVAVKWNIDTKAGLANAVPK